ncbi:Uncharacterized protein T08_2686 [Trichinella sp. T8]|nr:Uncharacterized protein T08_2686 [Trichinella sp. T8]
MDNIQEKLLNEFSDLFDENIGTIKNTRATLHVKPRAEPKTFNARRIAFPLKKPVEAEIQRLVKEGILDPVDPAATPIEVTINPNLLPESHLLPIFEELTMELVGGQEFSTIDLKDASLQIPGDEKSQKYLTTHIGYFQYKKLPFGITGNSNFPEKGKENYCADALSRLPMQIQEPYTVLSEKEIIRRTEQEKVLREVKKCIGNNWLEKIGREVKQFYQAREEIAEENALLLKAGRVIIPELPRRKIIKVLHEGHPGIA